MFEPSKLNAKYSFKEIIQTGIIINIIIRYAEYKPGIDYTIYYIIYL